MNKIWIGLLLIFLDFNVTLHAVVIGLLPDFLGYIILTGGLTELASSSPHFAKVRPAAIVMLVYTALLYCLDLFGLSVTLNGADVWLGLVSTSLSLYILYQIVRGVMDLEEGQGRDLNGKLLYTVWKIVLFFNVLAYLGVMFPALMLFSIIGSAIATVVFLVLLRQAKGFCAEGAGPGAPENPG